MKTVTLYKRNNFNDVSWWTCSLDGKSVIRRWGHKMPLTLDSKNHQAETFETEDKAQKEYESQIEYRMQRRGYTLEVPTTAPTLPMLCQEYKKVPDWSGFALQPKLDGIRCIMSEDGLRTRTNLELTSCPHLEFYSQLLPPGIKLDGELYIDNTPMNIIESFVMRKTPAKQCYEHVVFNVFDIIDTEAPFEERIIEAEAIINRLAEKYTAFRTDPKFKMSETHPYFSIKFPFRLVETIIHQSPPTTEVITQYFEHCTKRGYEGCIIRNTEAPYELNKRSYGIFKLKEFFDDEFEIINVLPGKNGCGILQCKTATDETFTCNFRGMQNLKRQMLQFPKLYIGKWLKVEHEGFFDNGRPRCPVGIHFYDKKDHD